MNPYDSSWQKLVAAARRAPDEGEVAAPFGFATRVAALAMAPERLRLSALLDRFSWRALAVASAIAIVSFAANYHAVVTAATTANTSSQTEEDVLPDVTTVTAVYDVS